MPISTAVAVAAAAAATAVQMKREKEKEVGRKSTVHIANSKTRLTGKYDKIRQPTDRSYIFIMLTVFPSSSSSGFRFSFYYTFSVISVCECYAATCASGIIYIYSLLLHSVASFILAFGSSSYTTINPYGVYPPSTIYIYIYGCCQRLNVFGEHAATSKKCRDWQTNEFAFFSIVQ